MNNLKSNIDHYMRLKGIKMYTHLLLDIAHELGIKGQDAYNFVSGEKANFSKMLKGERPLKHDFIIPLEKIFGVPLARLLDEDAYKLPVEKDNVPFDKGFRYYAYLDDPRLYREEFDLLRARDGKSILNHTDEFGKNFLDYVVEYRSVNGVRYLHDEYGIKIKWPRKYFEFKKDSGITLAGFDKSLDFARLVASMDDAELFFDIYDSYNGFYSNGHYGGKASIFHQDEFLELILDSNILFNSIFEVKPYVFTAVSDRVRREKQTDSITYYTINPIINNCLRYALSHLEKYRRRAKYMLNFGIKHNSEIISESKSEKYYICDKLGGLMEFKNDNSEITKLAIFVDCKVEDNEIEFLIERLPKFKIWNTPNIAVENIKGVVNYAK